MKNGLIAAVLNLVILSWTFGQSKTIELTPDFYFSQGGYITEEISITDIDDVTEFVGLSCYHFDVEELPIYFRLKVGKGWSDWKSFDLQHEFVESSRTAYQAKAITGSFSGIQFRTDSKLNSSFVARLFFAGATEKAPRLIQRSLGCDLPAVCGRPCWCPTCPIDVTPEFTEPTHLIVHHSAGNNQSNDFATVVEFIWDLHVNTNGWDDIGYNWLIDPDGILYEGRPDNYQGAHFSCINENTVGICVIGDYSLVEPSSTAINTLINVLAHEATEHLIDISAQSFHVTGDFILDNMAGHRDSSGSVHACSATVCPGDSFYPVLPDIRERIAGLPCYAEVISAVGESVISDFSIFPNPFHDHLVINAYDSRTKNLEIVNIQGTAMGNVQTGIANDLSHLLPGVYFLLHNGQLIEKIIKE